MQLTGTSIEVILLKLLLDNNIYNKYINYININNIKEQDINIYYLYIYLSKLKTKLKKDITVDEFQGMFFQDSGTINDKNVGYYTSLFEKLRSVSVSPETTIEILDSLRDKQIAFKLAQKAYDASEGRSSIREVLDDTIKELDHKKEIVDLSSLFVSDDLNELLDTAVFTEGLPWRLGCLNRSLGPLRKGDFGFVFARPETGKTTFLASEAVYMAEKMDRDVLWFNNEEQGSKVKIRCFQAAFGITLEQLMSNRKKWLDAFNSLFGHRFKIIKDDVSKQKRDIERIIDASNPGLIIFDQIDKIDGFAGDREDLKMGAIYQWARELAKSYAPVIGVCQADGTGEGVKWLNMGHVANAKTAKQAEADWILGIGKSHDDSLAYIRHLNISKNKLIGGKETNPELRHGRFDVNIFPNTARYEDI